MWDTLDRFADIDGRKAIFLVSTGLDTTSYHGYPDLLKKATTLDTQIYSLGIGSSAGINGATAVNVLKSLAEVTRGPVYNSLLMDYQGFFEIIRDQLRNRYSLGFVPTDRLANGTFHKLKVQVPPLDIALMASSQNPG